MIRSPVPRARGAARVLACCALFSGLAVLPLAAPAARATAVREPAGAPQGAFGWYYYNGEQRYAVALEPTRLSVRARAGLGATALRALLAAQPEVDVAASAAEPVSELGWTWARLRPGLSAQQVLAFARALGQRAEIEYAEPAVVREGELLGLTNQLLVSCKKNVSAAEAEALFAVHGLRVLEPLAYAEHGYLLALPRAGSANALAVSAALMESGQFEWSLPEFVVERVLRSIPNDPSFANQWHLNSTGQSGAKLDADVDAPEAWNTQKGASSIVVAIIDGGIESTHEDLAANAVAGWDFLGNDASPAPSGSSDNHGTACSGVACARQDNALGLSGVAPGCRFMPIRLVGTGQTTAMEANAFAFAKNNGAAIMSNSWGPPDGTGVNYPLPANVQAAIDDAATNGRGGKGCLIFWASGNGNESVELDGYAKYSKVLAVAASTDQDLRAYYSDYGPSVDVCAPSNGGLTSGIWTTDRTGSAGYSATNYTNSFGGTSSACPLAAGVMALVLSQNPALSWQQAYNVITASADKIDAAGGGWAGGFSQLYGFGKVNANAAVALANNPPGGGGGSGGAIVIHATDVPKSIPDNNASGVSSTLNVASVPGAVVEVDVSLSISHTYKGDLVVTLIGPDNTAVLLHNQSGGSADNLITTYDTLTAPVQALSAFVGKTANGAWKLKVQDLAAQDVGTLTAWSLALKGGGGGGPTVTNKSSTDVPKSIPDNNAGGISSVLPVAGLAGTLKDANVSVSITHTYKGDLKLTLVHPDGTQVLLHNQTGGSADNIATTYDTLTAPAQSLSVLNGKTPNGTWQLKVQDLAAQDVGTLTAWSLQLTHQ